jgi:hypothetical protein
MMMKGPFRELIPVGEQKVRIRVPRDCRIRAVRLLVGDRIPEYTTGDGLVIIDVPSVLDHEVIAMDVSA